MLTLMLLRHAKAVQHAPDGDFARPLTAKGETDAAALGVHLAAQGLRPDRAMVSSSQRTTQTFDLVQTAFAEPIPASIDAALYNASAGELRDRLRDLAPEIRTLLIVGHNPGIMDLAVALGREGDLVEIGRMRDRYPPCSLAVVTFDAEDWQDARVSSGRLDAFLMPDDLVSSS